MATVTGWTGIERPIAIVAPRRTDRELIACAGTSAALIIAGGLVAAVNSAAPFAHGSWLAAYLVLVGGVAQLALGVGPLLLPAPWSSGPLVRAQLLLWNAGTGLVAVGVLTDVTAVVIGGSVVVLGALACFARNAGPAREPGRGRVLAYRVVIAVLAISVITGIALSAAGSPGS